MPCCWPRSMRAMLVRNGSRVELPMKWGVLVNNQLWCNKNTISVLLHARTMCIFMHVIVLMSTLHYMPKKWAFTFPKYSEYV